MPLHPIVIGVLLEALEARERFLCTQDMLPGGVMFLLP